MPKRAAVWIVQAALAAALAFFIWRRTADDFREFNAATVPLHVDIGFIAVAAVIILATYGLLIFAWQTILRGWEQTLRFRTAARIWLLSNLGRYLPGKIWSIAGLAVLAQREGISGWAATGAAVVMQALALGTAAVVVLAVLPGATTLGLVVAAAVAIGVIVTLSSSRVLGRVARVAGTDDLRPVPGGALLGGGAATVASWVAYGIAFWFTARGLVQDPGLTLPLAIGTYAAAHVIGLVALFAPGGIGVREGVMLYLLAPTLGAETALVFALGSRLLMTATEVAAALTALVVSRGTAGAMGVHNEMNARPDEGGN